ncbi:hypothetical protein CRUP_030939 [Coryphaenoides rupestris]|nr:hypothetical protein CRUP_030939 [Coryphaenoides rupestris]
MECLIVMTTVPTRGPLRGRHQCTVTRSYLFLHKFWFFSTIYYFGNWVFIGDLGSLGEDSH